MNTRCSAFVATSLDGFIARPDGNIDWLNEANAMVPADEDCGFEEFINSIDTLVMGRNTFEQVLAFDVWPYGKKPVVVLSRRPLKIPEALSATVTASSEPPRNLVTRLNENGAQRLYIDGGITIQRFLEANLIDDITITVIPLLLGSGLRLFGPLQNDAQLSHVATTVYDFGFVQSLYMVERVDSHL